MKLNWFVRKGIFYWPVTIVGYVVLFVAAACAVYAFIDINSKSHSVSDVLINFVFYLLIIGLFYTVIGYFTEKRS